METFSYEHSNGTVYDFVLTMKAKSEIEKAQKRHLKNPDVARLALGLRGEDGVADLSKLSDEQLIAVLPHMDELGELDPLDVGFIVLSNYRPYQGSMTSEVFETVVEDMENKIGLEDAFDFFVRLQQSVFTRLAAMQKIQENKLKKA